MNRKQIKEMERRMEMENYLKELQERAVRTARIRHSLRTDKERFLYGGFR